jgi:transposase
MRYELSDYEWTAIKPMLPNKQRGIRHINDRAPTRSLYRGQPMASFGSSVQVRLGVTWQRPMSSVPLVMKRKTFAPRTRAGGFRSLSLLRWFVFS